MTDLTGTVDGVARGAAFLTSHQGQRTWQAHWTEAGQAQAAAWPGSPPGRLEGPRSRGTIPGAPGRPRPQSWGARQETGRDGAGVGGDRGAVRG